VALEQDGNDHIVEEKPALRPVERCRQDLAAIGAPGRRIHPMVVAAKNERRAVAIGMPNPNGLVFRCGGDTLTIRAVGNAENLTLMTAQRPDFRSVVHVPDAYCVILTGRGHS
jgi:hypothetical protein